VEVAPVLMPPAQVGTLARGAAVSSHVVRVYGGTSGRKVAGQVGIEPAVITQTMKIDENGAGRTASW
jgi:hypothetical protein